jgi:hypothetical protein
MPLSNGLDVPRCLHGEPGDDLLFGQGKIHLLDDGLRRWLADNPAEAAALAGCPSGPLAITHRTGRRPNSPGTGRSFDSIWLTSHWTVRQVEHLYDEGIAAGSDHAVVVADLMPITVGGRIGMATARVPPLGSAA